MATITELDALRHLAACVCNLNDPTFFTAKSTSGTTVEFPLDVSVGITALIWLMSTKSEGVVYRIKVGEKNSRHIHVFHVDEAGPAACRKAIAHGIEELARHDFVTVDRDAKEFAETIPDLSGNVGASRNPCATKSTATKHERAEHVRHQQHVDMFGMSAERQ
ncbi:hypothetical protein OBBRIDRAFT_808888 [Obba rivulosa]|uniref:Uncharacterized protein n=1 Tax=Obba rivulosa TaxID=1052685 RepID=A0A8E2AQZ0_9APHY|nr:hypothetical protein OBBRIDRAFT_808888 [Obba rivulosa]